MTNTDQENRGGIDYSEKYKDYSDDEIFEILRNHKEYQDSAVNSAVKIALERELIHSDQDLMAPEFQNKRTFRFTLFPRINSSFHYQRLVGSIFRYLFVVSLLPVVYGFLKYGEGELDQTVWGVALGVIWFGLCVWLKKTLRLAILFPIFGLLAFLTFSSIQKILVPEQIVFQDLLMVFAGTLVTTYLLLYLKNLIANKPDNV
ncbi:MAG: hypothetical protein WC384_10810 [Prolixibacteraceae bacterium]